MKIIHAKIGNGLYRLEMSNENDPCKPCYFMRKDLPCPMDVSGLYPSCIVWIDEIPMSGASWKMIARLP